MKKSLLVTIDFPPTKGGISHSLWQFTSRYAPNTLAVLTVPSDIHVGTDYPLYRRKILSSSRLVWPKWLPLVWHMLRIARQEKATMIQAGQILPIGTAAFIIKKMCRIPYIVYVYGQDLVLMREHKRKMSLIEKILRNADGVIACSEYSRQLAISLGADKQTSRVAYPCIARSNYIETYQQDKDSFLQHEKLQNKKVLLAVGNLVKRKGHDMTLRALAKVKNSFSDVVYLIVGRGPERQRLETLVKELKLTDMVRFYDRVSNEQLALFYNIAHAFIMPSRELKNSKGETVDVEGFGMVFLEANTYGCPVIGGRSGGVAEAVAHEQSGLLVDPEDPDDIAAAIIRLLSDDVYAKRLGAQGRERALNNFRLADQMDEITSLLHD